MTIASRFIFNFLLNALWQIPLLASIAWISARALRHAPAAYRHALWTAALLAAIILPMAGLRTPAPNGRRVTIPFEGIEANGNASQATAPVAAARAPAAWHSVDYAPMAADGLLALFLVSTLFAGVRLGRAYGKASSLRRGAERHDLPGPVAAVWARTRAALGSPSAELRWSAGVASPVMVGIFRKTVILPESMRDETAEDVLATALGHELGHAVRNDFAWNLCAEILALPVSMHPAAHFLLRRIRETRELACDELVTRNLMAPRDYARSMVAIAARLTTPVQASCSLGVFDGNIFEERIRPTGKHLKV